MKRFKLEGWQKCEFKKPYTRLLIPRNPAVYLIVLKTTRRKIIYIGSSKCLHRRICSHQVIALLKRNIPSIKLEIWYKDFSQTSMNYIEESNLIHKLNPLFNGISQTPSVKILIDRSYEFWKEMGVREVKINHWRTEKIA